MQYSYYIVPEHQDRCWGSDSAGKGDGGRNEGEKGRDEVLLVRYWGVIEESDYE